MDKFQKEKNDFLIKIDKSKKHSYDKKIIKLVNLINKNPNYYTTSSCSGRTRIFEKNDRRYDVKDIFVNHDKTEINNKITDDIINKIKNRINYSINEKINNSIIDKKRINKNIINKKTLNKNQNRIYFQYESLILHVCCRTIEDANKILKIARKISFKRSGIITKDRKIIIEIINPEYVYTLISKDNKLLIDGNYLKELLKEANEKMQRNEEKIQEFYDLSKIL